MKKHIILMMALFLCVVPSLKAYEYFTIYYQDGTKSVAFYATDVDSIRYSKIGLDSLTYDTWQVQEIWMVDSTYRIPLADIDHIDFTDVDEKKVAEDMANANNVIVPLFTQCSSTAELSQHLPTIVATDGVEDAWTDNQTLFVKIKDWGTITFLYPPAFQQRNNLQSLSPLVSAQRRSKSLAEHTHIDIGEVCIYNQTENNLNPDFDDVKKVVTALTNNYEILGVKPHTLIDVGPEFFEEDIFNYDQIFLLTHGAYDSIANLHWLYTNEELLRVETKNWFSEKTAWINYFIKHPFASSQKLGIGALAEIRNGKPCVVYYTTVSEKFISSSPRQFKNPDKAMIFNVACQSLKDNFNLAEAFIQKGASCYLGYTDTNGIGHAGGEYFFDELLHGSCVQGAFQQIPAQWKTESFIDERNGKTIKPELKKYPLENRTARDCVLHPNTLPIEDPSNDNTSSVTLKGCMKMLYISEYAQSNTYGFLRADNPDMNHADTLKAEGVYDAPSVTMNFETVIDTKDLTSSTTYYQAYMHDGFSYCYGEVKEFTTGGEGNEQGEQQEETGNPIPYVAIKDGTVTFYYDRKRAQRKNTGAIEMKGLLAFTPAIYYSGSRTIHHAVFDASFAAYAPTSTMGWFYACENIQTIEGLSYLNTSNVTDMSGMFYGCSSLTSIDLSHFDTSNVTNMLGMFNGCSSLTSIDLSHFDTSNVTNMGGMFSGCSSLTSIDLSHFDTSNVTNMFGMFRACCSLISIDLSHWNTSNVTDMSGLFRLCNSLKTIDLRGFNPSSTTEICDMFSGCTALKTIYAGDWPIPCLINFDSCYNLTGGQGTKIGENLYGYDKNGNPLYYYCYGDGSNAHIDGGKDNPGLFTAK